MGDLTFGSAREVLMRLGFSEHVDAETRIYEDGYGTIVVLSGQPSSVATDVTADALLRVLIRGGIPRDAVLAALEQI